MQLFREIVLSWPAMVEKAFLFEPQPKAATFVHHPSIMAVIGLGAFLLIGETVGTAQELPTGTISLSARAFIERSGLGGSVILPLQRTTPRHGKPWSMVDR
jgi:hypothetical protein